jgi:hypothetical protein
MRSILLGLISLSFLIHLTDFLLVFFNFFELSRYFYSLKIPTTFNSIKSNSPEVVQFQNGEMRLIIAIETLPNGTDLEKFTRLMESQLRESDPKMLLNLEDITLGLDDGDMFFYINFINFFFQTLCLQRRYNTTRIPCL